MGNRIAFAVVPVEGFSPDRIRSLKRGIESTLGVKISAAAILDRDYRSDTECRSIESACRKFCDLVVIHECKEVENFLLVPSAIDRAAARRAADREQRTGKVLGFVGQAEELLNTFALNKRSYIVSQYLAKRREFSRRSANSEHETVVSERALEEFDSKWKQDKRRLEMLPGKEALSVLNQEFQSKYGVSVTSASIIKAMRQEEISAEARNLIEKLSDFSAGPMNESD